MLEKEISTNGINIFTSIKDTVNIARNNIAITFNSEMIDCYWNIGKRIYEAQENKNRDNYDTHLIKCLSEKLTKDFGEAYSTKNLKDFTKFYELSQKNITLWHQLTWSHIKILLPINNEAERNFYVKECVENKWSVEQLVKQIHASYYERSSFTQQKYQEKVKNKINTTKSNCTKKDTATTKHSTLNDKKKLFISKYIDCLPTEEELENYIIEQQKLSKRKKLTYKKPDSETSSE